MSFKTAWIPGAPVRLPAFPDSEFRVSRVYPNLLEIEVWITESERPDLAPPNSWVSFGSVTPSEEGALRPLPWAPITPRRRAKIRRRLRVQAIDRELERLRGRFPVPTPVLERLHEEKAELTVNPRASSRTAPRAASWEEIAGEPDRPTLITGTVTGTKESTGETERRPVRFKARLGDPWTEIVDRAWEIAFPKGFWHFETEDLEERVLEG